MHRWVSQLGVVSVALVATLVSSQAQAFCGFFVSNTDGPLYNDATKVALMREGTRTVISMGNNYKGPAKDFAMVVPVPVVLQKENVKTLKADVFDRIEKLSAPRLVEYWERDPCYTPPALAPVCGDVPINTSAPGRATMDASTASFNTNTGVVIESQFSVGEYDVVVLSAQQSDGLETWLTQNNYKIPAGSSAALAPYVADQMKFFVAKVDVSKVAMNAEGVAELSPLRFHYEDQNFRLPVRLGLLNAQAKQDLLVFILSSSTRYETSNYPNVFIPTNLNVTNNTRTSFGSFYATLFDETLEKAGGKAVVTEHAWSWTESPYMQTGAKCDPCPPSPPTNVSDLAALGGDILWGLGGGGTADAGSFGFMKSFDVHLTRLHARYDGATLKDDLVFQKASTVQGGDEPKEGRPSKVARVGGSIFNRFQARYAIRHTWSGEIKCAKPQRGVWEGKGASPAVATQLAAAPRQSMNSTSFVVPDDQVPPNRVPMDITPPTPACPSVSGCSYYGTDSFTSWGVVLAATGAWLGVSLVHMRRRVQRKQKS